MKEMLCFKVCLITVIFYAASASTAFLVGSVAGELQSKKFVYDDHKRRDPFVPLVNKSGVLIRRTDSTFGFEISQLNLEGILWDEKRPLAIINGKIVGIGDAISKSKVMDIERKKVYLDFKGKIYELEIKQLNETTIYEME